MNKLTMIAVDLGAGSGRTIAGRFDGNRLELVETHRFPNEPVMVSGSLYWDILRLYHEMKQGIIKSAAWGIAPIVSVLIPGAWTTAFWTRTGTLWEIPTITGT